MSVSRMKTNNVAANKNAILSQSEIDAILSFRTIWIVFKITLMKYVALQLSFLSLFIT